MKKNFVFFVILIFIFSPILLTACSANTKDSNNPNSEEESLQTDLPETDEDVQNPIPIKDLSEYTLEKMGFASLPVMTVDLQNDYSIDDIDRVNYVQSNISILNTNEEWLMDSSVAEIRGRGNGSWVWFDKKGYRIKFSTKQSLFGQPSNKHWVLSAAHDDSLLRDAFGFGIVNEVLDGIEYSSSVKFVELFINGTYNGVYRLLEHVRVDESRVNIDSDFDSLDTGFLLEYDIYMNPFYKNYYENGQLVSSSHTRGELIEGIDYFKVQGLTNPFAMASPDPDDYTDEAFYRAQVRFIQSYMQQLVDAATFGEWDMFTKMADVNSFVDKYILHELLLENDFTYSSFYLYKKPGGKVFLGPAWDMGQGMGSLSNREPYGIYGNHFGFGVFPSLLKIPQFTDLVRIRWADISADIVTSITNTYNDVQLYNDCFDRDAVRWDNPNWKPNQIYVRDWLFARIEWLDETWTAPVDRFANADENYGKLLILQVGGQGSTNDGAIRQSFVELYNNSDNPIDLSNYSLQISNSVGTDWTVVSLVGTILPHTSFLILGNEANEVWDGLKIETNDADFFVAFNLSNNQYKVCLVHGHEKLLVTNPFDIEGQVVEGYVDLIGAVNSASDSIDASAGTRFLNMSKQKTARRNSSVNTNNNNIDFATIDYRILANIDTYRPRNQNYGVWIPWVE